MCVVLLYTNFYRHSNTRTFLNSREFGYKKYISFLTFLTLLFRCRSNLTIFLLITLSNLKKLFAQTFAFRFLTTSTTDVSKLNEIGKNFIVSSQFSLLFYFFACFAVYCVVKCDCLWKYLCYRTFECLFSMGKSNV